MVAYNGSVGIRQESIFLSKLY